MRKLVLFLGLILISEPVPAYDNPDKIAQVEPGMNKEDVWGIVGPPDTVVSKSADERGAQVEVYRYDYSAPPKDPAPAKEPFIKPEFSRDAKTGPAQEPGLEQKIIGNPPYHIRFVDGIVQSVSKS